jgi:hypothetical protein
MLGMRYIFLRKINGTKLILPFLREETILTADVLTWITETQKLLDNGSK